MAIELAQILSKIPAVSSKAAKVTELSGGITNKNYRVDVNGDRFVVRVSDKSTALLGIHRNHEAEASRAASRTGVGAEVIYFRKNPDVLVTRFISGEPVSSKKASQPATLKRIVDSMRRYHRGPRFQGHFSPFAVVARYHREALKRGVAFPLGFRLHLETLAAIGRVLKSKSLVPCHNDLLPGNFIDDGKRIRIIDWEYAAMGDAFFDLGNLAANCEFGRASDEALLKFYFGRLRPEDLNRLRMMKAASAMRECLWGFLQSGVSQLDFDFKKYAQEHLNRFIRYSRVIESSLL